MADDKSYGFGAVGEAVAKLDPDKRKMFVKGFMGEKDDNSAPGTDAKPDSYADAMKRRMGNS